MFWFNLNEYSDSFCVPVILEAIIKNIIIILRNILKAYHCSNWKIFNAKSWRPLNIKNLYNKHIKHPMSLYVKHFFTRIAVIVMFVMQQKQTIIRPQLYIS